MKYNKNNKPMVCMMTQSTCYKESTSMEVLGVLWHSTGANNPNLKRYVQPDDDAANRNELLELIGKNQYKNDLNHYDRNMGVNAWIGKLANGEITTLQTLPWNHRPWGCGKGKKGSCNSGWIQFEICEDSLNNKDYFDKIYKEACELTAYLCKMYNIDPFGTQTLNNVVVPTILCHADSYKLGLGNNHGDVLHWFKKYNKTMDDVRKDVAALLGNDTPIANKESIGVATSTRLVNVRSGPGTKYKIIGLSRKGNELEVIEEVDGWFKIIWNKGKYEYAYVDKKYFNFVEINKSYKGQTTASTLNIRSGAGTDYNVVGKLKKGSIITIVEEKNGWGKLDDNKGWVSLQYVKQI